MSRHTRTFRPSVEHLEAREVPATAVLSSGLLSVSGTAAADAITVRQSGAVITVAGVAQAFPSAGVARVAVNGLGGDDVIEVRGLHRPLLLDGGVGVNRFRFDARGTGGGINVVDLVSRDVEMFAVKPGGVIYRFSPAQGGLLMQSATGAAGTFQQIGPGNTASFATAPDGTAYALGADGVLRRNRGAAGGNCDVVVYDPAAYGAVRSFAVSPAGVVYLSTAGQGGLLLNSGSGIAGTFQQIGPGSTADFSMAPDGTAYALGADGVLRRNRGAAGGNCDVVVYDPAEYGAIRSWAIRPTDGRVYALLGRGVFWGNGAVIDSGVSSFAIAPSGRVFALKSGGTLMMSDVGYAPYFQSSATGVGSFSLTRAGAVLTMDDSGSLRYSSDGATGTWSASTAAGFSSYSVAGDGRALAMSASGQLFFSETGRPGTWQASTKQGFASFAWLPSGAALAMSLSGQLWYSDTARPGSWSISTTEGFASFSASGDGRILLRSKLGQLWYSDNGRPGSWYISTDLGFASYTWLPTGAALVMSNTGQVWYSDTGRPSTWNISTTEGFASFAVSPNGAALLLSRTGQVWYSDTGRPSSWYTSTTAGFATLTVAANRVYLRGLNDTFWVSDDGRPNSWSYIDGSIKSYAVAPAGRVYALKSSGELMASDLGYAPYFWTVASDVQSITTTANGSVGYVSALRPASIPVRTGNRFIRQTGYAFNPLDWAKDGFRVTDIRQHLSGICVIAATLASAADAGIDLGSRIRYAGNSVYHVRLFEFGWRAVRFDGTVYSTDLQPEASGTAVLNGQTLTRVKNFWPLLFARAYLQAQGVNWATDPGPGDANWDNGFLNFRPAYVSPKNAGFAIAGGDKNNWDPDEGSAMTHLANNLALGSIVTVGSYSTLYGAGPNSGHMWAVLDLYSSGGVYYVRLFDPNSWKTSPLARTKVLTWSQFVSGFDTMTMVTRAGVSY